ncbi:MAG: hypothetical protein DRJ42_27500 [Deltaproteobacteria bacterium]|nr:MAG: hypothetical protein DRJ42_27500 [Deltaproteobacteria bacterium]
MVEIGGVLGALLWATALLVATAGCGAGTVTEARTPEASPPSSGGPGEASREALVAGDLDRAAELAGEALDAAPADVTALQVAARVALARGQNDRVISLLRDAARPDLVRLRARARQAMSDLDGAARDLAAVDGQDPPDGWADAMLPLARAGSALDCYGTTGSERATLPFVGRSPLPVVEVSIGGRSTFALLATQADLTIIDDDLRGEAGIAESIDLGGLVMANVPALVRDLAPVSAQVGEEVGVVLGLDVLLRLHVTIDFRERWVVVSTAGDSPSADVAAAPFLTLGGTFLAVEGRLDGTHDVLLAFDTAGPFPVAIEESVARSLGHDVEALPPFPGAPSSSIRTVIIRTLAFGQVEIAEVPAATGLVPAELSELAGAPVAGILGAIAMQQMRVTLDPEGRRLLFD